MLLIVVYLYVTSLTLWSLNATLWFKRAHVLLMDHPELSLTDRRELSNADLEALGTPWSPSSCSMCAYTFVKSAPPEPRPDDSRGQRRHLASVVLYSRSLWVMTLPCLMLLMSFSELPHS
jgi:hypothetical protein